MKWIDYIDWPTEWADAIGERDLVDRASGADVLVELFEHGGVHFVFVGNVGASRFGTGVTDGQVFDSVASLTTYLDGRGLT